MESLAILEDDAVFDRTHSYTMKGGEILFPPGPISHDDNEEDDNNNDNDNDNNEASTRAFVSKMIARHPSNKDVKLKSIYLANGIHHHVTLDDLEDLPDRFPSSNTKARITWFCALCMAGIGMFIEAYIIITTGQIKTTWHSNYPPCWVPENAQQCPDNIRCCGLFPNTPFDETTGECAVDFTKSSDCNQTTGKYNDGELCEESILDAVSYSEFAGIMVGMLVFGTLADIIGVNSAGILTSILMIVGNVVMCFIKVENNIQLQFSIWIVFFGIFGLGVGGEYPLTAAGAAEHHAKTMKEASMDDEERHQFRILRNKEKTARRGETIGIVFAMQGIGAVVGSTFFLALIYFSDQGYVVCDSSKRPGANSAGVDQSALNAAWRSFYFIGLIFVVMVFLYRWLLVDEGKEGVKKIQDRKANRSAAGKLTYGKIFGFYGTHVIATGGCWFLWDIAFYGLKLFSGPIFEAINPSGGLVVQNGYLLINNIIALAGYYVCAMIIDYPKIGRKNVQTLFFTLVSIVFLIMSFLFESLSSELLIFLYFLSSFLGQFVNTTTYVMAAETYPAELRGTLHGVSAFMGKCGALLSTIVFGMVTTETIFLICGVVGLLGTVLTVLFSVDMTHVSLSEYDVQLELFLEGRLEEYKGRLNKPCHLSLFERLTGRHGEYDPDWAMKFIQKERTIHRGPESKQ